MNRPMRIMLIALGILFGVIFLYKEFQSYMTNRFLSSQKPIFTVSTIKTSYSAWQPTIRATGSIRAIKGVNVTTELAGMVQKIYFTPGSYVTEGTVLVQLNADAEIGQLQSLQANAALALITYDRDVAQFAIHAVSKQTVDTDRENLRSIRGQVAQQAATVAKKTIRAPFTGRLGISYVNPGQYINTGDKVASLQTLDPIYMDFYIPQQELARIKVGQLVNVTSDIFRGKKFNGKVTTIDPAVDTDTRNVTVEATLPNPTKELTPGMFAYVTVDVGSPIKYLTLPQTAVSFNSYGDIVYVVHDQGKDEQGKPVLIARQVFVTTGDTRGDQIAILKGIKEGDTVVTAGQQKLKNNSRVTINNTILPSNDPNPTVVNEKG
jgi:membrane fusion protein, multidrug efflux system